MVAAKRSAKKAPLTRWQRVVGALDARRTWVGIVLVVLCFLSLLTVRFHTNNAITGDEPHYLLMSYSLVHDHDLNLKNNYERGDSAGFYPGLSPYLQVGPGQGTDASGRWYSIHAVGLPLVVTPAMWLAGVRGVEVMMVLISTVTIVLTWYWTYLLTKRRLFAYLAAGGLLLSYSFNGLAGYIYPDVLAAALTLAALIIIEKWYAKVWVQAAVGFIAGFLLLLHFKLLAVSVPLLLVMTYKTWRHQRKLPWATVAVFLPLVAYFFASNHGWFGVWNPTGIYKALDLPNVGPAGITSGVLFDSMRGLVIYNPVLLLAFVGLPIWFKRHRESFFMALAVTAPSALALMTFRGWQGGDSQIGRYAMDFVPVLIPAVAFALIEFHKAWQRWAAAALYALSFLITVDSVLIKRTYVRYDVRSPLFVQFQRHFGLALDKLLPTFDGRSQLMGRYGALKIIFWYLVLIALTVYGWFLAKSAKPPLAPKSRA